MERSRARARARAHRRAPLLSLEKERKKEIAPVSVASLDSKTALLRSLLALSSYHMGRGSLLLRAIAARSLIQARKSQTTGISLPGRFQRIP